MIRAHELEGTLHSQPSANPYHYSAPHPQPIDPHSDDYDQPDESNYSYDGDDMMPDELEPISYNDEYARQVVEEEGAFSPSEQQFVARQQQQQQHADDLHDHYHAGDEDEDAMLRHYDQPRPVAARMDPPEDEPPSLKRGDEDSYYHDNASEDMNNKPPDSEWDDPDHQLQDEEYYESREVGKYYVTSEESPSLLSGGVASPPSAVSPSESDFDDPSPNHRQTSPRHRSGDLPPISPRSPVSSDVYSQHSSAMKGAQELLRRNRQRRAASAASQVPASQPNAAKQFVSSADPATHASDEQDEGGAGGGRGRTVPNVASPNTDSESGNTWESGSDFTGSSVWTDGSFSNPDRSSRRALILQMAKARMKSNKKTEEKKMDELDLGGELD